MKLFVLAATLVSCAGVFAQPREIDNYIQGLEDRVPDGATGPGIVYTTRTTGRVISIGAPITKQIPVGQDCSGRYNTPQFNQGPSLGETAVRAVIGGAIGSRFGGGGTGRDIMIAAGAAAGAASGYSNQPRSNQGQCVTVFEQRIIGYSYVAQHQYLQMQGFMRRQPQIGEEVEIIVRSVYYTGS